MLFIIMVLFLKWEFHEIQSEWHLWLIYYFKRESSNISRRGKKKAKVEKLLCSDWTLQSCKDTSIQWTLKFIFQLWAGDETAMKYNSNESSAYPSFLSFLASP